MQRDCQRSGVRQNNAESTFVATQQDVIQIGAALANQIRANAHSW